MLSTFQHVSVVFGIMHFTQLRDGTKMPFHLGGILSTLLFRRGGPARFPGEPQHSIVLAYCKYTEISSIILTLF